MKGGRTKCKGFICSVGVVQGNLTKRKFFIYDSLGGEIMVIYVLGRYKGLRTSQSFIENEPNLNWYHHKYYLVTDGTESNLVIKLLCRGDLYSL